MSDIPEDVMKAACEALGEWTIDDGTVFQFAECAKSVARAIMEERERCAKVCTGYRKYFDAFPDNDAKTGGHNASRLIENGIRHPAAAAVFGN